MNRNYLYVVLAAVFWGTMGIFVNVLSSMGLTTAQIAMLRAATSLIFTTTIILSKNRELFKINLRDIWMFLGSGIISYFLFTNCYFAAIRSVGVAVSSVLLYTSPIFVTLMSCILFREKMTGRKLICLALAVGGCALVSGLASGNVGDVSAIGILLGLASGFAYALYSIFSTYALRKYQPLTVTFYTFLFGTAASLVTSLSTTVFDAVSSVSGVLWVIALGIISGALPYFFYTVGLAKVKPSHAAVIATVEPVVASLIGIFLFRENADIFTLLGIVFIISAAIILNLQESD